MLKSSTLIAALVFIGCFTSLGIGQRLKTPGHGLAGSWRLKKAERVDGATPISLPNPQGLIIFDSAGHTVEVITQSPRKSWASNRPTPEEALYTFNTFAGFWGTYKANDQAKVIAYHPLGGVNPSLMDVDLERSYELSGDDLVITSHPGESNLEGVMRWTWQRVPNIENLSAEYRRMIGFWELMGDGIVDAKTGETISVAHRAPSIIVYAPTGYIGVHFVPLNRKKLAGAFATPEEAQADIAGYIGYSAILALHPGWVVHHTLFTIQPGASGSLDRSYEVVGNEVHLEFPPVTVQGRSRKTWVILRRMSGEREMMGE